MKLLPLEEITATDLRDQIQARKHKAKIAYMEYVYGARNTYNKAYKRWKKLRREIKQLEGLLDE